MFAPGEKGKGTLHINIKQAKELPRMDPNGLTDGLVKCHLLPDKSAKGKRKTGVIKNNLNPVWEERFTYEKVTLEELSKERVLEACVCHNDPKGNNIVIGGVRLGSAPSTASKHKEWMDSIGDEVSHWEAMLTHPGEWVDRWHTLRHSMDPRSVDLTIPPSGSTSSFQHPTRVDVTVPSKVEELSSKTEEFVVPSVIPHTFPSEALPSSNEHMKLQVDEPILEGIDEFRKITPKVPPASLQPKLEPSPTEVSSSVAVKVEPSLKATIEVRAEPSPKEVVPSIQVKTEPSSNEDAPSVQVKAEPSPKTVAPSIQVKTEPKDVSYSFQDKPEQPPKELSPSVHNKAEPSSEEISQPVPELKPYHVQAEMEVHLCI